MIAQTFTQSEPQGWAKGKQPIPEPAYYGAGLLAAALCVVFIRRWRAQQ